jgi:hypothetical protein
VGREFQRERSRARSARNKQTNKKSGRIEKVRTGAN